MLCRLSCWIIVIGLMFRYTLFCTCVIVCYIQRCSHIFTCLCSFSSNEMYLFGPQIKLELYNIYQPYRYSQTSPSRTSIYRIPLICRSKLKLSASLYILLPRYLESLYISIPSSSEIKYFDFTYRWKVELRYLFI